MKKKNKNRDEKKLSFYQPVSLYAPTFETSEVTSKKLKFRSKLTS